MLKVKNKRTTGYRAGRETTEARKHANMIETWISLVRNGACVLKSLLPKEYAVMKPLMSFPLAFLAGGAMASSELERFTGLEGFIGLLQLAGAGFNLLKGAKVCLSRDVNLRVASGNLSWKTSAVSKCV